MNHLARIAPGLVILGLLSSVPAAAAPRVIKMKGTDAMKFTVERIDAQPGEELTVVLSSSSPMPKTEMAHNFVLLTPEADVPGFIMAAVMARATENIPQQPKWQGMILAKTGMAGNGETVQVTFKAPEEPGEYVYVCTFSGHYNGGMKGVLIVK